jgi:branched-chain amino acid transport system permease protein
VILVGWAGQISLGQFAFVGVGAATTGSLLVHAHMDMFLALFISALVGAAAAAAVGVPALRIPGLFLAVTTLAFGVPVATYLLNSSYFPSLNPDRVQRPAMLDRVSLNSNLVFYFVCLGALVLALVIGRNFRRSRAGRVVLAIRDNERAAASFGVEPIRVKLAAFSISGGLAGLAGGLFAIALRGVPFYAFSPNESLVVFTMVIVGGVTTLSGAVLGAAYVEAAQHFLHGGMQLLATGAGLLLLLMFVPGGLVELGHNIRDRWLRTVARRRGLSVPSLSERPDEVDQVSVAEPVPSLTGGRT